MTPSTAHATGRFARAFRAVPVPLKDSPWFSLVLPIKTARWRCHARRTGVISVNKVE